MRILSIGIMLPIAVLYALSGWAQAPTKETANPAFESGAGVSKPPADNTPAIIEGKGAEHQPLDEAPAASEPAGPLSATDKIVARFMDLDTDASGGVSYEEYMAMVRERIVARYAAMDTNDDGEVTDEEYRTFWKLRMAQWYRLKR
ncbi:MAG: hypothetical protein Q9M24_02395 [Mariprofundaceae bacterium]|nr:hypothetical protein [Mariprofundaceae bacterium]